QKELADNSLVVSSVTFDSSGNKRVIDITMKQVDDLRTAYLQLSVIVDHTLGSDRVIKIDSKPSKALTSLYEGFQPVLYEGIAKHNYTEMIANLQKQGQDAGLTLCRVEMDKNDIYIQLEKGSDYLYDVVPYTNSSTAAGSTSLSSGGSSGVTNS
ncbi:MAG: hypothetical protein JWN30_697, partial [Bacilli bacterium]|nr:hypothetical protein [Bacilli bacterium]